MVSKSDQLLIVVSILEGERPEACFCNCCLPSFRRLVWDRGLVNLKNPVICVFMVPTDLFKVVRSEVC